MIMFDVIKTLRVLTLKMYLSLFSNTNLFTLTKTLTAYLKRLI